MSLKIIGIAGSLRTGSYNRALLHAFQEQMPEDVTFTIADISALPFFNEDIEEPYPEVASQLKAELFKANAFIIATPEYNRGVPGVLKNAIDWMSRPKGPSPFTLKPVLVVGASNGNIGTAVAQASLKHTLLHLDAHVLGKPEFHLGMAQDKFDEAGVLIDEKTNDYINTSIAKLIQTVG